MKPKDMIIEFDWTDGAALAEQAEYWANDNRPWIEGVKWGQWEGLRRQGEGVRRWEEFERKLIAWMSDDSKPPVDGKQPPRRAWDKAAHGAGGLGLREALRAEIEKASRPPQSSEKLEGYMAKLGLGELERTEVDQYLRVQRARKFLDLLLMKIRWEKEGRQSL